MEPNSTRPPKHCPLLQIPAFSCYPGKSGYLDKGWWWLSLRGRVGRAHGGRGGAAHRQAAATRLEKRAGHSSNFAFWGAFNVRPFSVFLNVRPFFMCDFFCFFYVRPFRVRSVNVRPFYVRPFYVRFVNVPPFYVRPFRVRSVNVRPFYVRPFRVRSVNVRPFYVRPFRVRSVNVRFFYVRPFRVRFVNVRPFYVRPFYVRFVNVPLFYVRLFFYVRSVNVRPFLCAICQCATFLCATFSCAIC